MFNIIISQNSTNTQGPKPEKIVTSKFVLRVEYVHDRGWAAYYSDIDECIIFYEMISRQLTDYVWWLCIKSADQRYVSSIEFYTWYISLLL